MAKNSTMKRDDAFLKIMESSPHVVLLGAGASYACIPNGDKNGHKISCMDNFFQNTGIDIGYTGTHTNLEDIYQDIDDPKRKLLERGIRNYFDSFELPDDPTIYDALIISLTKKDLIASFNWDPLLVQACQRCRNITQDLPEIVFLHGNVREWSVPLLYPVTNKNYAENAYIKKAWDILQDRLHKSFVFTIFGYSGPKSDKEALMLLESGFLVKDTNDCVSDINNFKQLTIIDKNPEILKSFKRLLDVPQQPGIEGIVDYVKVIKNFWDEKNWLVTWPRLTTEGYTITQYEAKIPKEWPITISQDNLTWDYLGSIATNQINKEMI